MGGLNNVLLVSVIINAYDNASSLLAKLGLTTKTVFGSISLAALGVGVAVAGIGLASIVAASSFDQAMHKIGALTDTSAAQMQWYEQQILALAPQLDVAPTQLANGLYFVISAGEKGTNAINTLKYAAMAAAAGMTDFATVADGVTSVMNAYRQSNLDAGTATDVLTKAVVNGKTTWQAMVSGIGIIATTSVAAGVKVQEMAAALSALSQVAGAHASRRIGMDFMNLERAIGINIDAISAKAKKLGVSFDEGTFASLPLIGKLQYLAQITGGVGYNLNSAAIQADITSGNMKDLALQTAHANSKFLSLIGGAAAFIPAYILLSDKGKTYNQILAQMTTHGQATAQAFQIMRDSTGQKWNMFEVTLQSIATTLGLHLLPYVNQFLMALIGAGRGIIAFLQTSTGINALKSALVGIAVVIGAILAPAIIGFITGPVGIFVALFAAIVAVGTLLGPVIQRLVAHFGGLQGILHSLQPLFTIIKQALSAAGAELKKAFSDPAIQSALKQLQQTLPQLIPFVKMLGVILAVVVVVAFQLFLTLLRGVAGALPGFATMLQGLMVVLGGIGQLFSDLFTPSRWSHIYQDFAQIGRGILQIALGWLQALVGMVGGWIDHILGLFGTSGDKVKKAAGDWLGGIKQAIGNFFGGIGSWIGSKLGGAGAAIGGFFSRLGTTIHAALERVKAAFLAPFQFIANLFPWLYNHNYYVKALVDAIHAHLVALRNRIVAIIGVVRAFIKEKWAQIRAEAMVAWMLVYQYVIAPVQRLWAEVQATLTKLRNWLLGKWNEVWGDVTGIWNKIVAFVVGLDSRIHSAVQQHVVTPIQKAIQSLISTALSWGENLIKQFIQGIQNQAGNVGKAAQNIGGQVAHFLGFHSPSPGMPESATWGPNLVRMFASGMLSQAPAASLAAKQIVGLVNNAMAGAGSGAVGVGAVAGASLAGTASGGVTNVTHNWAGAFPNATNQQQIVAALKEVQQQTYRAARRPGAYQGLRAGI